MNIATTRRSCRAAIATIIFSIVTVAGCTQPRIEQQAGADSPPTPSRMPLPKAVFPDGFAVELELATTPEETTTGLMYRPSLAANRGMLLLWEKERFATIWMMNVLVPLDIIFLNDAGQIVELVADAKPCSAEPCPRFTPHVASRAVLEVAAGSAALHGLEAGLTIDFVRVPGYPASNDEPN
jgi:uncharacterized membrane protein (UPF0127 family)